MEHDIKDWIWYPVATCHDTFFCLAPHAKDLKERLEQGLLELYSTFDPLRTFVAQNLIPDQPYDPRPFDPSLKNALGLPEETDITGKYVKWILVHKHANRGVGVLFHNREPVHSELRDRNFYLIPTIDTTGSLIWTCRCAWVDDLAEPCGGSTVFVDEKYLPTACRR